MDIYVKIALFAAKAVLYVACLWLVNYVRNATKAESTGEVTFVGYRVLRVIYLIMLLRDGLFIIGWEFNYLVNYVADVAVLICLFFWMRLHTGFKKPASDIFLLLGVMVGLLFIVYVDVFFRAWFAIAGYLGLMGVLIAYIGSQLFQVSEANTENPWFITEVRSNLVYAILFTFPLAMLLDNKNWLVQLLVYPIMGFVPLVIVFRQLNRKFEGQHNQIVMVENELGNLFSFMRRISSWMSEKIEINLAVRYIVETAVKDTQADGGAVLMIDDYDNTLRMTAMYGVCPPPMPVPDVVKTKHSSLEAFFSSQRIKLKDNVLGEAVETAKPIFIRNAKGEPRLKHNQAQDLCFISSFIAIPLVALNRVLGVLTLVKRTPNRFFTEDHFNHIQTFAEYTSLTINNLYTYMELLEKREIEREVGIAAEIQKKLVPEELPTVPNLDISVFSVPLKGVSGDYFDLFKLDQNKMGIFMCDVAGKGVPASLIMVMIHSILHLIANPKRDVASTLTWLNRGLFGRVDIDHYATVCYMTVDVKHMEIHYSNAAHHPLLVLKAGSSKVIRVDTEGLPIGIEGNTQYQQKKVKIEHGDVALLYTDGIIESMNMEGEQYGIQRLLSLVRANSAKAAKEIEDLVRADIQTFVGRAKQHDDLTLLIMKVL